jgi:hypothetical protein
VKSILTVTVSALALAALPTPSAAAQHQHMPGMTMPMPEKPAPKKPAAKKKAVVKKPAAKKKAAAKPKSAPAPSEPVHVDHSQMDHGTMSAPVPTGPDGPEAMPMDHAAMGEMAKDGMEHAGHGMAMTGAFGPYPMTRESSGTAWQPDTSEHSALHVMSGDWTLMAHGVVNLVYDHQAGRRGDDKAFASGMLMGMARDPSPTAPCSSRRCSVPIR